MYFHVGLQLLKGLRSALFAFHFMMHQIFKTYFFVCFIVSWKINAAMKKMSSGGLHLIILSLKKQIITMVFIQHYRFLSLIYDLILL